VHVIGVDIGGSGIKAAPVDLETGSFADDRARVDTPKPATPEAVAQATAELISRWPAEGFVGVAFPAVVKHGTTLSAANVDPTWIGTDAAGLFAETLGRQVWVLNDADAAGLAEARFGAAAHTRGVVVVLTFGTGIGSAIFLDGRLLPNSELGHLELDGVDAETRAAARVRKEEGLSWSAWAERVNRYLAYLDRVLNPDLIVIGGGVSNHPERFMDRLQTRALVAPATLGNRAGIVGAALHATLEAERTAEAASLVAHDLAAADVTEAEPR